MSAAVNCRCLCSSGTSVFSPVFRSQLQFQRYASSGRLHRRDPARVRLSQDVGRSRPNNRETPTTKSTFRPRKGPFTGMNQTAPPRFVRDDVRTSNRPDDSRSPSSSHRTSSSRSRDSPLFRSLNTQSSLLPIHYDKRNQVKALIEDVKSFKQFPLLPVLQEAIHENIFADYTEVVPTPIQRLALPALLKEDPSPGSEMKRFLLAGETGTGKTLAYLLPVINSLKKAEVIEKQEAEALALSRAREEEERRRNNVFELESPRDEEEVGIVQPKVIILQPTAELVAQVGRVVKQLSHTAKFRSVLLSASYTPRRITNNLFRPGGADVVITTPHLLSSISQTKPYLLSKVTHIVVDEADSLMDRSFAPITTEIISRSSQTLKQLILCSATIPRSLDNFLIREYPQIRRLTTPNLHAIPRRTQLGVVDVQKEPYRGNKNIACADIIWSLGKAGTPSDVDPFRTAAGLPVPKYLIVFVNERETVDVVTQYLTSKGIDAISLSRDTSEQRQSVILDEFTTASPPPTEDDIKNAQRSAKLGGDVPFIQEKPPTTFSGTANRLPGVKVLVTTDLGSRGIDTVAVRTVILYDVPNSTIDFIHRLGRAGRMNRRGRGIALVGNKDRKDIVREVKEAMYRGAALV